MKRHKITKEDIKKQSKANSIVKKRISIENKIQYWNNKLKELYEFCPHYNSWYENCGSSGNWDRDESYWRHYECEDCGNRWNTDQSYEQEKKYPYSIKGKRSSNGEWEIY